MAPSTFPWRSKLAACFSVASRSIATGRLARRGHVVEQRGRPERAAMQCRVSVLRDRSKMISCGIALVSIVAVAWVRRMMHEHFAVPRDLRDNGRGGDGSAPAIPVQHAALRHQKVWNPERVDED